MARLDNVLWVGGAQWAGKTTVARLIAARYPVVVYAYDYHDARSHSVRAKEDAGRFPGLNRFLDALEADPDSVWSQPSPEEMADQTFAIFDERFSRPTWHVVVAILALLFALAGAVLISLASQPEPEPTSEAAESSAALA